MKKALIVIGLAVVASIVINAFGQSKAVAPEAKTLAKPSATFVQTYPRYIVLSDMIAEKQKEPAIAAYLELVRQRDSLEQSMVSEMDQACKDAGQTGCRYSAKDGAFIVPKAPEAK